MSDKSDVSTASLVLMGAIVGAPVLIAVSYLLRGWVLSYLWAWFMVPIFHLPALKISQAIGIGIVAGFLTHQIQPDSCKEKSAWERVCVSLMITFMTLLFGYVTHLFMVRP